MDISQALKDTENSLRDFIAATLRKKYGDNWIDSCGMPEDRINHWKGRKNDEERRQKSGVVEERLLYYADFYDIKTILHKNWGKMPEFPDTFGDWKTTEVWLSELEKLRDPDAHRRELLPHQKNLVLGIAGEIRTRIIRYRSKQETIEGYFAKIESVRDSLGNIWTPSDPQPIKTGMTLRVGDTVDFVITATDPLGETLLYSILPKNRDRLWQEENYGSWTVSHDQVGHQVNVFLLVSSSRDYRAHDYYDDVVVFTYDVLPPRRAT
jgi:hypothetical protein